MKIMQVLGFIVLLAGALIVGRQVYSYLGKGILTITSIPNDANITIDKNTYTNATAKNIPIKPGDHLITVSSSGYITIQQTVEVGWQEAINKQYTLKTKPLRGVYAEADGSTSLEGYDVVQEKFFLNNTWAAGYLVPTNEDEGDISVLIMNRRNGVWKIILHNDELPDDAAQQLPPQVYEYLKDFGGNGE